MGQVVRSRAEPTGTPSRQYDGHLQTFKSATSNEHTKEVGADKDEVVS